ncbi:MAG: peptidylprolyl isomerase [Planctomycetota bacterium]|jgi:parvulin-like peptidyl-prolyl isomerase|nr:peptidylprolyl isomerase [Planctomycetota bacterium]MDP6940878.1 peptidylprolyl isomerase [Planctomycetota bacterium]
MTEPSTITLQHILIQKRDEAEDIAKGLFERAQGGEDFEALMKEHSEDPGGGTYAMLNNGVEGRTFTDHMSDLNKRAEAMDLELREAVSTGKMNHEEAEAKMKGFIENLQGEAADVDLPYPRATMVKAFGDVGFALEVGGIGLAPFHEEDSPFGWHIIRRTN